MIPRIIYSDKKVYYKIGEELSDYFGVTLDELKKEISLRNIPITELKGFGDNFIEEKYICDLQISDLCTLLKTRYIDKASTFKMNASMTGFINFLYQDKGIKIPMQRVLDKTDEEFNKFNDKDTESNFERKNREIREQFNKSCEKYGYADRVVPLRFISKERFYELWFWIDDEGNILYDDAKIIYNDSSDEVIKECEAVYDYEADEHYKLHKGKAYDITSLELFNSLKEFICKGELDDDSDNGEYLTFNYKGNSITIRDYEFLTLLYDKDIKLLK